LQTTSPNKSYGFTLIETLIVLIILALAAGALRIGFNNLSPSGPSSKEKEQIYELSSRAMLTLETQITLNSAEQLVETTGSGSSIEGQRLETEGVIIFAPNGGIYERD